VADEEVLAGGNLSVVVRVGDTVRRPMGPWSPAVHALLQHLDGFDGAPRLLGVDERGREIIEYIPGAMAWPEMGALQTDDGLARAGDLLRRYHEAVASFEAPIVCHNDCAAWNLVRGDDRWAFIDWDTAGPRPRLWDVAYAVIGMVLVDARADHDHRVAVLADGYGLDAIDRRRLREVVIARAESSIAGMRRRAERGEPRWVEMWHGGHRESWEALLAGARQLAAQ
jgi:Ser/Thr protein kinase RdoA (MazF antagonist)